MTMSAGSIVVFTGPMGRWTANQIAVNHLKTPPGSVLMVHPCALDIARGRNQAVRALRGEWMLMLDDDLVFAPDILMRLLPHLEDVDIVCAHVRRRHPPHNHLLYAQPAEPGGPPVPLQLDPHARGLVSVHAAGTGGVLIHARVFAAMSEPWFRLGEFAADAIDEDLGFCQRARAAGFRIGCDLDVGVGHLGGMAVWPAPTEQGWQIEYRFGELEQTTRETRTQTNGRTANCRTRRIGNRHL